MACGKAHASTSIRDSSGSDALDLALSLTRGDPQVVKYLFELKEKSTGGVEQDAEKWKEWIKQVVAG